MPRRARIVLPDVPVHLIQRGHNKRPCFFTEFDYQCYLYWLANLHVETGCDIHAYVLMTNHVHLAVTPHARDSLAHLMKALNQHYVGHINKAYQRTGTLWEGRFKTCLMFDERYFMTCMRYIELNPVRASMVSHPGKYTWSSYRANAEGAVNPCITPHPIYLSLGADSDARVAAYRRLVAAATDEDMQNNLRRATNGNYALGEASALEELSATLGRKLQPGRRGRPPRPRQ